MFLITSPLLWDPTYRPIKYIMNNVREKKWFFNIWVQMYCIACVIVGVHMVLIEVAKKNQQKCTCTIIIRCLLFRALSVHNSLGKSVKWWLEYLFIKTVIKGSMWKENLSLLLQRKGKKKGKKGHDMKALGPDEKVFQRCTWMKSYLIQKVCKYPA